MDIDAQFFADLPTECGIRCLSGLDFPARELRQPRCRPALLATAGESG
jgi:hypothetical protein